MDITTDGFGYMLAVGDLSWVPFTYSLQARYLAFEHIELGGVGTGLVVVVAFTGYWIFRSANGEKNDFRNGRNPKSKFLCGIACARLTRSPQISLIWRRSGGLSFLLPAGGEGHGTPTTCLSPALPFLWCFIDAASSGDLLMALSWSLATGFDAPITYFYPVYFFVLLVHRQLRDDEMCEVK